MAIGGSKNKSKSSQTTQNPYAIDQYQQAVRTLGNQSWQMLNPGMVQQYTNPFSQQMISGFTAGNEQARQMARNSNTDSAIAQHAFGGTGMSVENALTNQLYDENSANYIANLLGSGFNAALGVAEQQNEQQNQFPLAIQALLGQLAQGTQENSQDTKSGSQFGFSWAPQSGFNFGDG